MASAARDGSLGSLPSAQEFCARAETGPNRIAQIAKSQIRRIQISVICLDPADTLSAHRQACQHR
jgi:hypothetical protein